MTQDAPQSGYDVSDHGFYVPSAEEGLAETKHRLARTYRSNEMVWLVGQTFDPVGSAWVIDVVRQGAGGRWVRQRSRFDIQAEVLYYMGEQPLTDAEFNSIRRSAKVFQVAEWQG
jgi:hypothetical protein